MAPENSIPTFLFPPDPVSYICPTWDQLEQLTLQVAQNVLKSQDQPEIIVTLAKGGWPMTRSLADFLQVDEIASIGVKFYAGIHQRLPEPQIYQDLPIDVAGKRLLLFDDVADSGGSLKFVSDLLAERNAASVTMATLFYKTHSSVKPDFYVATTDAWIIFPFEKKEMSQLLREKWRAQSISPTETESRLKHMGIALPRDL